MKPRWNRTPRPLTEHTTIEHKRVQEKTRDSQHTTREENHVHSQRTLPQNIREYKRRQETHNIPHKKRSDAQRKRRERRQNSGPQHTTSDDKTSTQHAVTTPNTTCSAKRAVGEKESSHNGALPFTPTH